MEERPRRRAPKGPEPVIRAFLFSDMVRSTDILSHLTGGLGDYQGETRFREQVRGPHNERLEKCIRSHEGEMVGTEGDSYFVAFRDARQAVECAVAVQRSLINDPIPIPDASEDLPQRVQVRIGMHTGAATPVPSAGRPNYHGMTINVARRIQEYAKGEQVLTSFETWHQAGKIEGLRSREWPGHTLKGVKEEPWTLVEVLWDARQAQGPKESAGDPKAGDTSFGELRRTYLQDLVARYEWLDFSGIPQVRNIVRLRLEDIFVPLSATKEMPEGDTLAEAVAFRHSKARGRYDLDDLGERGSGDERVSLRDALTEPRLVILGEPGSGKTTLLKHIALVLADKRGDQLGLGKDGGALLPILFPIAAYATALRQRDRALSDYLGDFFATRELGGLAPLFLNALEGGRAIVLLDGLDEVQDPGVRLHIVRRVEDFVRRFSSNRFVVTSRIAGYETARLTEFNHVTVLPFSEEDIKHFAGKWCLAYEHVADVSAVAEARAAQRASDLISAIKASDKVRRLATNPLLLTIIALIHYQNVRLPERRVELYRLSVEALAESWNRARSLGGQAIDLYLGERRLEARFVVNVLGPVALWLHESQPGGLMEQRGLESKLAQILREREGVTEARAGELAYAFLNLVRRGSGLLQERGVGLYGFLHLTFEEYLAARAIADIDRDPAATLLKHWPDPAWHEVILLTLGASPPAQATRLVESVLAASAEGEARGKNIVLAGQALADVGRDGVVGRVWERTVGLLVDLLEDQDPAKLVDVGTRVDAGDVVGLLGDPRLTDDAWVEVPAGEFLMGTAAQELKEIEKEYGKQIGDWAKDEFTQRRAAVNAFRIGKYPVTNQEFKRFMDARGYETRENWSEAGWKWLQRLPREKKELPEWRRRGGENEPRYWHDPNFGLRKPNRPVTGVTWYEAQAFCNWFTERLRKEEKIGKDEVVRLPAEAEWEKAARGVDGRWWPWGSEWDPRRANTGEGGVGGATPVGIYPSGVSPFGVFDMAGNVWEWTSSLYKPYPYKAEDGREDPSAEGRRVLRGGSCFLPPSLARCSSRLGVTPVSWRVHFGFRCVVAPHRSPQG